MSENVEKISNEDKDFFVKALDFLAISLLSICQSYYDQSKDETGSQRKPKPKRESPSLVTAKMVKL